MFAVKGWDLGPVVKQTAPKKKLKRKRDEKGETDGRKEETSIKASRNNPFVIRQTQPPNPHVKSDPSNGQTRPVSRERGGGGASESKDSDSLSPRSVKKNAKAARKAEKRLKRKLEAAGLGSTDAPSVEIEKPKKSSASAVSSTFTPLQEKMRQKLAGSQFRHINEKLYTTHSSEALSLFTNEPSLFHSVQPNRASA